MPLALLRFLDKGLLLNANKLDGVLMDQLFGKVNLRKNIDVVPRSEHLTLTSYIEK